MVPDVVEVAVAIEVVVVVVEVMLATTGVPADATVAVVANFLTMKVEEVVVVVIMVSVKCLYGMHL